MSALNISNGSGAVYAPGAVAITGGTINGTTVGATTPASGAFTTLSASGAISGAGLSTRSYLAGLTLSTAGSSATMSIAAGVATDSTNVSMMTLAAFTKTTSAWTLGSAGGGLDTGAIANGTWYHFFEIQRPDTGVVDVVFSLSATAPTMPTSYTLKRNIASWKTNGSAQWVSVLQDGDLFQWLTPILDVNDTSGTRGNSAVTVVLASVPTGKNVIALMNVQTQNNTGANTNVYLSDLATVDLAASTSAAPLASAGGSVISVPFIQGIMQVRTDTAASIRSRLNSTTGQLLITTLGWIDRRGRDA